MSAVKKCVRRAAFLLLIFCVSLFGGAAIQAQQKERTLEEIKAEALKRVENGMYPLIGLDPADVREAFSKITGTDNDEWAAEFSAVADRYMSEAKAAEASDPAKASAVGYVAIVQRYPHRLVVRVGIDAVQAFGSECRGPPHDAMDVVASINQKFRKV